MVELDSEVVAGLMDLNTLVGARVGVDSDGGLNQYSQTQLISVYPIEKMLKMKV
jgi:hypothetical protein